MHVPAESGAAPAGHVTTHLPASHVPLAQVTPVVHAPPWSVLHAPLVAVVDGGQSQRFAAEFQTLPVGLLQMQLVAPWDDVEPVPQVTQLPPLA